MKLRLIEDKNSGKLFLMKTKWVLFPVWKTWEFIQEPVVFSAVTEGGEVRHTETVYRRREFTGEGAIGDVHSYVFKEFLSRKKQEEEEDLHIVEEIDV